jgi:hypothetical protein
MYPAVDACELQRVRAAVARELGPHGSDPTTFCKLSCKKTPLAAAKPTYYHRRLNPPAARVRTSEAPPLRCYRACRFLFFPLYW